MGPNLLLLNTATAAGSVAVTSGETVVGELLLNLRSTHSDRLLLQVSQLLADTDTALDRLEAIGVVVGPGAFTGLRVGVATAKGLALASGKPLLALSSLQGLASQVPCAAGPVCALLDARKSQVYAGLFHWQDGHPRACSPERVIDPEALLEEFSDEVLFVGDGAVAYRTLIVRRLGARARFAPWPCHVLRASSLGPLALAALNAGETCSAQSLAPVYIRPSEAEITRARRLQEGVLDG